MTIPVPPSGESAGRSPSMPHRDARSSGARSGSLRSAPCGPPLARRRSGRGAPLPGYVAVHVGRALRRRGLPRVVRGSAPYAPGSTRPAADPGSGTAARGPRPRLRSRAVGLAAGSVTEVPPSGAVHAVIVACGWIGRNARLRALRHRNSLAACAGADFRIDARAHARPPSRLAFRLRPIDRVPSAPSEDRAGEDAAPAHPGPPPQAAIAAHPVDRIVGDIENRGGLADVIGGLVRRLLPSLAFLEERAAHAEAKSGQRPFTPRPLRARPRTPASRACSSAARSRRT